MKGWVFQEPGLKVSLGRSTRSVEDGIGLGVHDHNLRGGNSGGWCNRLSMTVVDGLLKAKIIETLK